MRYNRPWLLASTIMIFALFAPTAMARPNLPMQPDQPYKGPSSRVPYAATSRLGALAICDRLLALFARQSGDRSAGSQALPPGMFLDGFATVERDGYRARIQHIVRLGAAVVYSGYQTLDPWGAPCRRMLVNAVRFVGSVLDMLDGRPSPPVDRSRMTVVGRSRARVHAVGLAAVVGEKGLSRLVAIMPDQPSAFLGCSDIAPNLDVPFPSLTGIPDHTRLLMVVGRDDDAIGESAANALWADIRSGPSERRDFVVLRSDNRSAPPLVADRLIAETGGARGSLDALDRYGARKLLDLVIGGAHDRDRCDRNMRGTGEQTATGSWSDRTRVRGPLIGKGPILLARA